ncbi:MAG: ParA family protein, partial [Planctomycetota bacterium]
PSHGKTIFDYAPDCHGAEDYHALAREVLGLPPEVVEPEPRPEQEPIEVLEPESSPPPDAE